MTYGALITPLGDMEEENFQRMVNGDSGVSIVKGSGFNGEDLPLGKILDLDEADRFLNLLERACTILFKRYREILSKKSTKVILSSTKADIDALPNDTFESSRSLFRSKLETVNEPLIISNACISGILAINTAADYIKHGIYEHVIVIGIDTLSDFIKFGFQSLFAISSEFTTPFDTHRKGINIGEALGAVVLSKDRLENITSVEYLGGSSSNDANHISGPSRTGEGLFRSVNKSFKRAGITCNSIDFISAHGTGTIYNDEMESIAFDRLNMNNTPLNSMKGFFGHTLGAAGIIEVIASMKMMEHNLLIKSLGFSQKGTSCAINVLSKNKQMEVNTVLKTGSGFGGGNASLIIRKIVE
jgi:3-oxoacyl-[acyl-carrier-protein] synthase-1